MGRRQPRKAVVGVQPKEATGALARLHSRLAAAPPRARQFLVVALYVLLSLGCLVVPSYSLVFPAGKEPRLIGPDPYFHLRHIKAVLANYPVVARRDFMVNFPNGETGLNQGFFDVSAATVVKLTGGALTPLLTLVWISPICLILTGILGYFWMLKRSDERCASLFLLFLLLYPGPLSALGGLGHGDHHIAEVLLAMIVALSLDTLLRPSTSWRWAPLAMAPLFFFYLCWAGTPLHLLLVGLVFYLRAWQPDLPGLPRDAHLAHKGAVYGLSLLLAVVALPKVAPWAVIWSVSEGLFVLGAGALAVGYPILVAVARRPWRQPALAAAGFAAVALLITFLTPRGRDALGALTESRTLQIAEHAPVSVRLLFAAFGLVWLLALAAPFRLWQRQAVWNSLVPLAYGAGLVFFWVKTYDFNYYTPPILAAAAAYTVGTIAWNRNTLGLLAILVAMPLIPSFMGHPWVQRSVVRDLVLYSEGLESASTWLKSVQGAPKSPDQHEYGLVAPWDLGNILSETADTPVGWAETVSRGLARLVYSDDPEAAYQEMARRKLRYILLPARNLGEKFLGEMAAADLSIEQMFVKGKKVTSQGRTFTLLEPSERNKNALLSRLYWGMGQDLGHFRLVYESPQQTLHVLRLLPRGAIEFYAWPVTPESLLNLKPLLEQPQKPLETSRGVVVGAKQAAEVRVFEAVTGALVEGRSGPEARISARLKLFAPTTQRRWTCSWSTTADPSGWFSLRLPYSTTEPLNEDPNTIEVRGPYRIDVGGRDVELPVLERQVQQGERIPL